VFDNISRRNVLRAGLAAGTGAVIGLTQPAPADATRRSVIAFVGVTVIDTTGGPPRPDQTVVVQGIGSSGWADGAMSASRVVRWLSTVREGF
jgi:hypothetical protein